MFRTAWHNAFAKYVHPPKSEQLATHQPEFTVYHAPHFEADDSAINSQYFVIVHYAQREVIIGGTRYAGELRNPFSAL